MHNSHKRVEKERKHWEALANSDQRDINISDPHVTVEKCIDAIYPYIKEYERVLEIGCGIRRITKPMAIKMPNSYIYGVDISDSMIDVAEKNKPDNATFWVNDGRRLHASVEAIYSMTTFQHIDEQGVQQYLYEIYESLLRGGVLRFQFVEGTEKVEFSWNYSMEEMKKMLDNANLKIINYQQGLIEPTWTWITAKKYK